MFHKIADSGWRKSDHIAGDTRRRITQQAAGVRPALPCLVPPAAVLRCVKPPSNQIVDRITPSEHPHLSIDRVYVGPIAGECNEIAVVAQPIIVFEN